MWIHLLGFNLCNQARGSTVEDQCNKPWRPLPSGRISMADAIILKYFVVASSMIISYGYSMQVFYSSVSLWFCTAVYHEGYGEKHYISKCILNGLGYSCFALGEMLVAGRTFILHQCLLLTTVSIFQSLRPITSGPCPIPFHRPHMLHHYHHHSSSRLPGLRGRQENGPPNIKCHLSEFFADYDIPNFHTMVALRVLCLGNQPFCNHRIHRICYHHQSAILSSKIPI